MMTLDEAIEHAEWAANNCEGECSEEHKQLAEWLRELVTLRTENERLEELLLDLFCLCFPQNFEWEVTNHAWEKYLPCKRCEEAHGGKSPCASTSKDLAEECCKPFQAVVIADRMRELGIEVE